MKRRQYIVMGVFAALFLALGYLGWAMLVKPVEAKIEERNLELKAAKDKLAEAEFKAAQHDKFQALAENIRRDLVFMSSRVDPVLQTTDLFRLLSSLGNRYALPGYTFEAKPRAKSKDTGLSSMDEIPVVVKFKSAYQQVGLFLNSAISEDRLIVPDRFILAATSPQDDTLPSLTAEVDMRIVLDPGK